MPLLALLQFHPRERLEEQALKAGDVEPRCVDKGIVLAVDAADLAFIGYGQPQRLCEFIINAVAASTGVD